MIISVISTHHLELVATGFNDHAVMPMKSQVPGILSCNIIIESRTSFETTEGTMCLALNKTEVVWIKTPCTA